MSDVSSFLASASYDTHEAFRFDVIGKTISGLIVEEPRIVTTRNMSTGAPEDKLVLAVRDNTGKIWSVWIRKNAMAHAVHKAVTATGCTKLERNGQITITYARDGERKAGMNPPKLFTATYQPPAGVSVDDLLT